MNFEIFGPFKIERKSKRVDKAALPAFWEKVDEQMPGLSAACGCYMFATSAGGGFTPWYIGKAEKRSFADECFDYHKRDIYDDVLAERKGTPVLFLVAKMTGTKNRCAQPGKNGYREVEYVESLLIGTALKKNAGLMNIKKTGFAKNLIVPGLMNTPRGEGRKPSVRDFCRAIGC